MAINWSQQAEGYVAYRTCDGSWLGIISQGEDLSWTITYAAIIDDNDKTSYLTIGAARRAFEDQYESGQGETQAYDLAPSPWGDGGEEHGGGGGGGQLG